MKKKEFCESWKCSVGTARNLELCDGQYCFMLLASYGSYVYFRMYQYDDVVNTIFLASLLTLLFSSITASYIKSSNCITFLIINLNIANINK